MKASAMSWLLATVVAAALSVRAIGDEVPAKVDFVRDIQPILVNRCIKCHGAEKQKGGLRLDSREDLLSGGDHGPAPGSVEDSRLLKRVMGADPDGPKMPYKEDPLSEQQIALLTKWVAAGTPWPASANIRGKLTSNHWAFQPIKHPAPPAVQNTRWVRNAIDQFVLAKLEAKSIAPSPEADRITLIRRLSLDLTGLPPTPEEVDAFVRDTSGGAYDKLVDRLLASKHYGERWGRHWLDQARYADSNGYSIDAARMMWPYRDWVINAFNADMPFDRFTIEQLAGDLLPKATTDQLVATGFHRNTLINQEGGSDPEQFRVEACIDRTNTTGAVWLGLTVGCAQCHSHKFDPITQREYYQLYAFFNNCADKNSAKPQIALPTPAQIKEQKELDAATKDVLARLKEHDEDHKYDRAKWEGDILSNEAADKPLRDALKIEPAKRKAKQLEIIDAAYDKVDAERAALHAELALYEAKKKALVAKIPTTMIMGDLKTDPRVTHVHLRGDFLRHGAEVRADTPGILPAMKRPPAEPGAPGMGATRLDLAKWLVSPEHPLTARVTINRIWMHYFGVGLVETENDFGTQGTPPSHPQLLDWLASEFRGRGWSMKAMHKLIVTSATYRQSSKARPELAEIDPLNRLLARQNRVRVEAEIVRDLALAASGKLDRKIGGPSVFPYQPDGVYAFTQNKKLWKVSSGGDAYRRGMYTFFYRSAPHPMLTTFDTPDFQQVCTRRLRSNTPLQALTVANDPGMVELAEAMAAKLMAQEFASDEARITRAFRLCLARPPEAKELATLMNYYRGQLSLEQEPSAPKNAALAAVCRVMLNLDEFITRE